jgi:ATP-dependent RNA helicase DeaD
MEKKLFSELSLSETTLTALTELGFEHATQIQSEAIPLILAGRDVIGQAQTGTGKTAAFGLPMIEKLDTNIRTIGALVVCPTRELVMQVANELKKFAKFKKPGVSINAIYGGDSIVKQLKNLKAGTHIVVGTPGRLIDHLTRGSMDLSNLKMVVLDEADEMLNMGFREDIETILAKMPDDRQTVLFSATMPKPILDIARRFQKNPAIIKVVSENLTNASIEQRWFDVRSENRLQTLSDLMTINNIQLALCFCNMKVQVDELVADLRRLGFHADGLHGDLSQQQRSAIMAGFREGAIEILVATDVAARGIDVNNVDAVFNWELPFDPEYYVHRIGRTGRAGNSGKSFSFVTGRNEFRRLKSIEAFAKVRIEQADVPNEHDIYDTRKTVLLHKLTALLAEGGLKPYEELISAFEQEGFSAHTLAATLLKRSLPPAPTTPRPQPKPKMEVRKTEKPTFAVKPDRFAFASKSSAPTPKHEKFKAEKPAFMAKKSAAPAFGKAGFPSKKGKKVGVMKDIVEVW